ncbi:CHASE2 domain-containing protein [Desulfurispira natronophila]|uniref:Adenylate cyclase n=1 Tax=Desulfurispira natronophila TaxID=682562 RepID=A0A7W7Y5Q4_9BACT|nr:adenylate/guanylate cyclase domain-containing protein [Desulfurispira natronophila]MBB5022581.1 adenylate cyclase [Desulfurispira natronophila]
MIAKHLKSILPWQYIGSLCLVVVVVGEVAGFWSLRLMDRLEWLSYDARVQATLIGDEDPSIVLIDLDERSLNEIGQWPWPRHQVAELTQILFDEYGISILGFDIVFAEPEGNLLAQQWGQLQERYPDLPPSPDVESGDAVLARTLMDYPVVMGYYFQSRAGESDPPSTGSLPAPLQVDADQEIVEALPWPRPERFTGNLTELQYAAMGGGFFDNPFVDADGVFRRVPVLQYWEGGLYANLPTAMIYTLFGQPPVSLQVAKGGGVLQLEAIDIGGFEIPVDARGGALVPWYGPRGHFTYISAADILHRRIDPQALEGALAIFGASAPGLMDLRSTPVASVYPGPEINASMLAGILHQSYKAEPPYSLAAALLILSTVGILVTLVFPRLNAVAIVVVSTALIAAHSGLNFWAWQQDWVLPFASGVLLLLVLSLWHLTMNFWRESRQKSWVTERFGQYVPPELVDEMVHTPESFGLEGEQRELSVLFSDVRGFTSFSEGIAPDELTNVMNRLLTPITEAIHQHRGTIDKYMGDAVMAFWGAPLADGDHARHSLEGAFAMLQALEEINKEFTAEGMKALAMGIGINSGSMNVGNMGSEFRMAYTVMGDNVNLGSRLEGLTKAYGVDIIVSETTAAAVPDWACRRIDRVKVKGRTAPISIFEPIGPADSLSTETRQWLQQHDLAMEAYSAQRFDQAHDIFTATLAEHPNDSIARLYLQRIEHYQSSPPGPEWDGVWTHTEK